MTISTELYTAWTEMCAEIGRPLPINRIDVNMLIHEVAASDPPIESPSGYVRQVTLAYNYEDFENELPN